jgi:hypothetical protein
VVVDRRADAGESLPGEAAVRIVDRIDVHAGNAGATADEALQAVVGTEVDQAVDHERQFVCVTEGRIHASLAIARLGFETEATEVVAKNGAAVEALVEFRDVSIVDSADVEIGVFNEHSAEVEFEIPSAVAREGGRSDSRRSQRQS